MSPVKASLQLFRLPSSQHFITRLVEDIGDRRSLLLLVPEWVNPDEIWHAMWDELWRREFNIHEVWLPEMREDCLPAAALGESLMVEWPSPTSPRTTANLILASSLPDVIWLEGYIKLEEQARASWFEFLLQWAQGSKNIVDQGGRPAAICLVCPAHALPALPPEGILHLSVRWLWGIPSALEMQLLCRLSEDGTQDDRITMDWREHVLPSLAGSDVSLVEWLWDDIYDDIDHLTHRLTDYAQLRGWTEENLKSLGTNVWLGSWLSNAPLSRPDAKYLPLWGRGALSWTPEYGLELSSAALALLERAEEIQHRLWRAQAPMLLPLLDGLRLRLCNRFTSLYGPDWPVRWEQPPSYWEQIDVRENPLACQWGHLEHLVKNCPGLRAERRWLQLIDRARTIRNRLAHYRTVDFRNYEALYHEIHDAGDIL